MNSINLIGRLTRDVEVRYNTNRRAFTRFTLAVNRPFTNQSGEREADFISCVAWEKTAELIGTYFKKGSEIGISGRVQTGSYENEDGSRTYTTDVIVNQITFIGNKKESKPEPEYTQPTKKEEDETDPFADFGKEVQIDDEDLPWL